MAGVCLSLEDKVVLITGGSRGIGAATVRRFAQAGARVAFSYRQAAGIAEALAAECATEYGAEVRPFQQELSTPGEGRALVEGVVAALGRLDALVVNHAIWIAPDMPVEEMADAQWRQTMSVNLDSVFGVVQAGVGQMLRQAKPNPERGGNGAPLGHIVLISSAAGQRGDGFHADYAAAKGAVISFTKSLSTELASKGILVNCVAPGWVATEMTESVFGHPEMGPRVSSGIPLGRPGHPDEIAGPILFLCSPLAGFISGEVFNVNGGAVLIG